jgi:uncharacterized membrane protein YedE/YeeE
MNQLTVVSSLLGGALIGLASTLLLLTHGKVAGISGLYGGVLRRGTSDRAFRVAFVAGLLAAGGLVRLLAPSAFDASAGVAWPLALGAGALVGFGTQLGNGCTSGHGVCGIARLSVRSLIATATFMAAGFVTVFVTRHVLGGGR